MKKTEAMKIIIDELERNPTSALQMKDRRTKLHKAVNVLDGWVKYDQAFIDGIIDETLEEFESKENDYAEKKE